MPKGTGVALKGENTRNFESRINRLSNGTRLLNASDQIRVVFCLLS